MATKASKASKASTAVAVKANTNVVSIQEMLKAQVAQMGNRIAPATGATIRMTKDKQFVLPDGVKTPGPLDVVVVDFLAQNMYYEGEYDPKNPQAPTCFAIGTDPRNLVPSPNSPVRQAKDCATCPLNQWGSGKNGGKACNNERIVAVLPPDADEDTPLWRLKIAKGSIKTFDSYVSTLATTRGLPPVGVISSLSMDESVDHQAPRFSDPRPNVNVGEHLARQAEARKMLETEPDVSGYQAPKKAAGGRRR